MTFTFQARNGTVTAKVASAQEAGGEKRRKESVSWNIAELASIINDLHLWFRVQQDLVAKSYR